jgi:hypothetical protein
VQFALLQVINTVGESPAANNVIALTDL